MPDPLPSILAGFCIISAFITYGLGVYVFARNPSAAVNRLFLALTLTATYWALDEYLVWYFAGDEGLFLFWLKAGAFWIFIVAFTVHLMLVFTDHPLARREKRGSLLVALYLPVLFFSLAGFFTDQITTVAFQPGTGYVYLPALTSPIYLAEKAYITLAMGLTAYLGISSWQRARPGRDRRQNLLFCIGFMIAFGFGVLSGLALPLLGIYTVDIAFIGTVIFSLLIAYAIRRYGLFVLSPQTAATDIIRTMPDGLVLIDAEGRIITTNASAADIFGVAEADLSGQSVRRFIPDTTCDTIWAAIVEQGRFSDIEATPGGREGRTISIAGAPIRSPGGEPAGVILIIRDITHRRAAETALRTANQKLSLLSQVTCHDIGNDITGLAWYLNLLSEDRTHPDAGTYLTRSVDIVEDITKHLAFSRECQMLGAYQPVWQPLGPMIEGAVGSIHHPGVEIAVLVAPVEVYADPLSPKVVYNLLENALRHGGGITRICITTAEGADGMIVVAFEDDGVGVPDDEKERIFTYGYGKNTGFGLAFSRDVLSVTDIAIRETGTAGRGARFEILVPPRAWRRFEGALADPQDAQPAGQ